MQQQQSPREERPVVGSALLVIGAGHSALGAVAFRRVFLGMAAEGLFGAVQRTTVSPRSSAEREQAFWFEVTGLALLLLGATTRAVEQQGGRLPAHVGWGLGATALLGGALAPRSGFWLLLPPAGVIVHRHYRARSRPHPG